MKINTKRLYHGILRGQKLLKRSLRPIQRRLDPNWFTRLEQEIEYKVHWVSPRDIRFVGRKAFVPNRDNIGQILGGNWDELNVRFEQRDFYQAFTAVNSNESSWSETPFFRRVLSEMKAGYLKWDCRTEKEFRARLHTLEDLYREMSEKGYIPNHNRDQISVNIGRHGDLLFNDGQHRLTFAKRLDLPKIPIIIVARHSEWVKFKLRILESTWQSHGRVYAPLLHPDLEWIPAHFGHKRFELIRNALISQNGSMLDIGCNWGYFCHRFEDIGFECIGVEESSHACDFLEKLRRAGNKKFTIINQSIFDYLGDERHQYDVVLALAIFHHFVKSPEGVEQLKKLLSHFHAKEMYFLPHKRSEPQMQNVYWNPSEDEFVAFIIEHSGFSNAVCLGRAENGRLLYQIT